MDSLPLHLVQAHSVASGLSTRFDGFMAVIRAAMDHRVQILLHNVHNVGGWLELELADLLVS